MRDPRTTIPQAVVITIGSAILLYFAVSIVAVGAAGAPAMSGTSAPLQAASAATGRPWLGVVVSVGGVTAMLGVILSQLLGISRMAFAMARRGDLPRWLQHVHPRHGVPDRAVLATGAIGAIVAATGTLHDVAAAAALTILVYYGIANLAALRMPPGAKLYPDVVAWVGLITCTVLAVSLSRETLLVGTLVLVVGLLGRLAVLRAQD